MATFDYDLFVIGAGSGGVRAARMSGVYGARVAIAESRYLGGTCVNVGCIPKKLLVYASHFSEDMDISSAYGWSRGSVGFDWGVLINNKNKEIERLNGVYERLLKQAGVTLHWGYAKLVDPHTVEIDGKRITSERILVATGSWPNVPEIEGKEHIITSNEAFYLDKFPKRIIVVGGGYIAVEFAGIFHGLGSHVMQLYRGTHFLRGFDDDVRIFLAQQMRYKGIDLRFGTDICRIHKGENELLAELTDGTKIATDQVMLATGRIPNTKGLGLEALGVRMTPEGGIMVNDTFQTSVPSIYALGDVIDRVKLTPVAIAEAMVLAKNLFHGEHLKMDYTGIPTAVFSQPNIGTVGLSESLALMSFGELDIYMSTFRPLKHTLTDRDEKTMMKLVVDHATDRVLGCHMVGPDAGEIIQGIAIALKCGATKAHFDATVGIHPTSAEEFVTMREPLKGIDRPTLG